MRVSKRALIKLHDLFVISNCARGTYPSRAVFGPRAGVSQDKLMWFCCTVCTRRPIRTSIFKAPDQNCSPYTVHQAIIELAKHIYIAYGCLDFSTRPTL